MRLEKEYKQENNSMKKYYPDTYEIGIIRAFATMCDTAVALYHLDIIDLFEHLLKTDVFEEFMDLMGVYSQADTYIYHCFEEEFKTPVKEKNYDDELMYMYDSDVAYWMGYLLLSWHVQDDISGTKLLETYSLNYMYNNYDVLHTTSIGYAIDMIKENGKLNT